MSNAVVLFTYKSIERILKDGGTSAWSLVPSRARKYRYAICARNSKSKYGHEGSEEHQSAFLIGEIRDVVPAPGRADRYLILFSRYAEIKNGPQIWKGHRNPVKYLESLEKTNIHPEKLNWKDMPEVENDNEAPLTIKEAKRRLALSLGVDKEAIEIIVHG